MASSPIELSESLHPACLQVNNSILCCNVRTSRDKRGASSYLREIERFVQSEAGPAAKYK